MSVGDSGSDWFRLLQLANDELEVLRPRVAELEQALRVADDLLQRLSEWDVLNLAPGGGDDGPYWQGEIARVRAVLREAQE